MWRERGRTVVLRSRFRACLPSSERGRQFEATDRFSGCVASDRDLSTMRHSGRIKSSREREIRLGDYDERDAISFADR